MFRYVFIYNMVHMIFILGLMLSGADMKKRETNSSFPAAKWLRTFGRTLALGIAWNKCKALCQWSAFSHALIAVLKVTTFGVIATWAVTNSQGVWSHQATFQEQCSKDNFIGRISAQWFSFAKFLLTRRLTINRDQAAEGIWPNKPKAVGHCEFFSLGPKQAHRIRGTLSPIPKSMALRLKTSKP